MFSRSLLSLSLLLSLLLLLFFSPLSLSEEACNCSEQQPPREAAASVAGEFRQQRERRGFHAGKESWAASTHLKEPFPPRITWPTWAEQEQEQEGAGPGNETSTWADHVEFGLKSVLVVFRHGERSPLDLSFKAHQFDAPSGALCSNGGDQIASPSYRHPQFTLKMEQDPAFQEHRVWSHHRSDHVAKCYPGQLSNLGKGSMAQLGKKLRERYIEEEGLLGEHDLPGPADVHVHSTNVSRTIESVMYLVQGLFPDLAQKSEEHGLFHWGASGRQPVEIRLRGRDEEFLAPPFQSCPRFGGLWNEKSQEASLRNKEKAEKIISLLGSLINPWEGLEAQNFYDLLACFEAHGVPMPAEVTEEVFGEVADIFAETWWRFVEGNRELCRLGSGKLLAELDQMFSLPAEARPKFTLFSSHDTTLAFLLSSLGLSDRRWPPCSSQLIFEQYEAAQGAGEIYLRLVFNNEVLLVPGCVEDGVRGDLCPLTKFRELTAHLIPTDFAEECRM